jgi:prepilin-type N-terminal cleavage/methylation domain-containing protein
MSDNSGTKSARARGMTLLEVLVAMVLLVLVFIFVAENMIASSWAGNKSAQRSQDISAANYFMALMSGDSNLWGVGGYPDTPVDVCGHPLTPVNDAGPKSGGIWHTAPTCNLAPPEVQNVQYQWKESVPVFNSADITIWVRSTVDGKTDTYELRGFTHQTPTQLTLATPPPSPTPTPTPTPKPSLTPTPKPTATPIKTPTPVPTATPVKTPTPKPTATPSPTAKPTATPKPTPTPVPTATPLPI